MTWLFVSAVPPKVWVDVNGRDKITLTGGCPALHHMDVIQLACEKLMFSVCEKTASVRRADRPISPARSNQKQLLRMLSTSPQSIICPIQTSSPEEHVLWFKDGVRVQTSSDAHLQQTFNNVPIQQRARSLQLGLPLLRRLSQRTGGRVMHPSRLQGNYWCEVWQLNPLLKVKSPKFLVVFTDVITLHGTLQTRGVPTNTSVTFNYMDRAVDVPLNVANYMAIINNNITRSMRMVDPGLRDIASYVDHVDSDTGVIDFFIQISLVRNVPDNYKDRVVSHYLTSLHSVLVPLSRDISQHWNLSLPVTDAINLTRTDFCPPAYLEDSSTGFGAQFPQTAIRNNVDSIELCDGVAVGYANCQGNYETGAYWENWQIDTDCHRSSASTLPVTDSDDIVRNRKPNISEPDPFRTPGSHLPRFQLMPSKDLAHLDEIEIEDGNVRDVTDKMAQILDKTSDLTDSDIDTCAEVIGRIVKVTAPSASQMGHQLLHTVNRILDADTAAIRSAQLKSRAATRIVENLEKFSMKTDIGTAKNMRLVTPNVAMEVWNLDAGMAPVIGLGATVGGSWSSPLTNPRILTIRDRLDSSLAEFDVAIELPRELVVKNMHGESNTTRLSMLIYRKTGLFTPVVNSSLGLVNSAVISATLGGKKIEGLNDMIRMAFRPFVDTRNHLKTTKCAFWDFLDNHGMGGWSTEGCYYNGTMFGLDICMCNHLTNFAVLLDFYGHSKPVEPEHELTLSIISLVGLSLSIFGLALTIITFIFFKKLRQGRAQLTLFHMAVALLCSKVVFLVGIKQTNNEYFCLSVAVLLHYFILVSFLWMLIEAILQYMTFVKILGTYVTRYALKTAIPAWGLPLIPVISVLAIDYNMYRGRQSYCWMGMEAFYFAFAVPVGVIVVVNIVMFIIILVSLVRRPDGLRSTQSKQRRAKMQLKAAVTIFILLGLTWIFGFLQIEDARIVFQYIFTFLSSLQGFFIFVMLVARRKQVRDQWYMLCCNKQDNRRAPKQVSPTNSNSTSSNGSGGSLSLHNSSTRTLRTNIDRESFDSVYYIPTRRMPTAYKAL
ncbi:adhesion G-protein coupled receptor G6-like [Haliotis rubra]|uniref:adhesion G-protein coupled receptor G6-like n=1 Tax=Haliotis rubra TaxID=36100 RepID=UPI001EE4FD46|nr:adhesion G-protein coupled receptor G6-like [Haliotis rubra]